MKLDLENSSQGGIWKAAAATLAGMLATGLSAWLLFAQEAVTRDEVLHFIQRETPYIEDRKAIQESLVRNHESILRMADEIVLIRAQQMRMESKLDVLLGQKGAP
ncbi:MAG: hypothetical protein AMXMBFR75_08740 [Candidatus Hinthialibacteria bacterium]